MVFGNESAQQYLVDGNRINCVSLTKMLDLEHMHRIQLSDILLFSKQVNCLHILIVLNVLMCFIRPTPIVALNNYVLIQWQILPNILNYDTIITIVVSLVCPPSLVLIEIPSY